MNNLTHGGTIDRKKNEPFCRNRSMSEGKSDERRNAGDIMRSANRTCRLS